jgi:hypothetical protein
MVSNRRVSSPVFFKNHPFLVGSAAKLLQTIETHPDAENSRLSVLTGLGITKDANDGVLPAHLRYLQAMDLIGTSDQPGVRFSPTPIGRLVLRTDPYLEQLSTVALMAFLLSEPGRGAHLFDWVVRGTLASLRAFRLDGLRQDVNQLAALEGCDGAYPQLAVVVNRFVDPDAFGAVSPWIEVGGAGNRYEPRRLIEDLPDPIFWVCAYMLVREWRLTFIDTFEATWRDVDGHLLPLLRGILGIKERGRAEEQLRVRLHREGIITSTSVTTERIVLLCHDPTPLSLLENAYSPQ